MKLSYSQFFEIFFISLILAILTSCSGKSEIEINEEDSIIPCNSVEIFANETTNAVCFEEQGNIRKVYTNNFPGHQYG